MTCSTFSQFFWIWYAICIPDKPAPIVNTLSFLEDGSYTS
jgi:hypothetical protein